MARQGDLISWRKIIQQAKRPIPEQLATWRAKYEANLPKDKNDLPQVVAEGGSVYAPLLSIILAGIESGREQFKHHVALLDEILHPNKWEPGGYVILTDFPYTMAFIFQALHGAICLHTNQLSLAMNLAKTKVHRFSRDGSLPLYMNHDLIGWAPTLNGEASLSWDFLTKLPEAWSWLNEVFGEPDEFRSALCAYYMALNILELADTIASGKENVVTSEKIRLDVPLFFLMSNENINRKAYRLLINDPEQVRNIWWN